MNNEDGLKNIDIAASAGRELIDGLGDLAEAGLDAAPIDVIIDEIPVIKTLAGIYRAGMVIREGLYAKKLLEFFRAAAKSSGPSKKEKEQALINFGGEENRQRLGQTLMLLLDKADDMCKPRLHGHVIGCLLNGELTYSEAMTLCAIVDRIILEDLKFLVSANPSLVVLDSEVAKFSAVHRLQANGLMYQYVFGGDDTHFSLTPAGEQLSAIYQEMMKDSEKSE
jgi:hypothetical protein